MELWDLYDSERRPLEETAVRGEPLPEGARHIVVNICVFNARGEMLIQRRHPDKIGFPHFWDLSAGGSALAGETSAEAAERELFEELGLRASFSRQAPVLTMTSADCFYDIFFADIDVEPDELVLQAEEVVDARWATLPEILSMTDRGEFIPYRRPLLELLFEAHRGDAVRFSDEGL